MHNPNTRIEKTLELWPPSFIELPSVKVCAPPRVQPKHNPRIFMALGEREKTATVMISFYLDRLMAGTVAALFYTWSQRHRGTLKNMTKTQSANKKENEYLLHILYYLMFLLHNVYVFIGTYVTLTLGWSNGGCNSLIFGVNRSISNNKTNTGFYRQVGISLYIHKYQFWQSCWQISWIRTNNVQSRR